MNQQKYLSVSEFNNIISNILRAETALYDITILGEVSQIDVRDMHAYLTIKDKGAELRCTCFNYLKTYKPKCGESVLVTGSPSYYVKKGTLSFNIERIVPIGQGLIYLKLEELKNKLLKEGLFDKAIKKPLPKYANNIVVLTSIKGAVIRDIVKTVRAVNNIIDIKIYDVRVQGEGAAKSIIRALKTIDSLNYDVIIIARGGGSLEDLMPFNDEELARTVFALKTPVISAVGHETDYTICDHVADIRAATPTAAAEMLAYNVLELRHNIINSINRIAQYTDNLLSSMCNRTNLSIYLLSASVNLMVERNCIKIKNLINKSIDNIDKIFTLKAHNIDKLICSLDNNSPIKIMKSGYYRISHDGIPIYSVKHLKPKDIIKITGSDGVINAGVIDIESEE